MSALLYLCLGAVIQIVISVLTGVSLSEGHTCVHEYPSYDEIVHGVALESHERVVRRSVDSPLRIHVYYDDSVNYLEEPYKSVLKDDIIPNAVKYWEGILKVRRHNAPILLKRSCSSSLYRHVQEGGRYAQQYCRGGCREVTRCGDSIVPPQHLLPCRECQDTWSSQECTARYNNMTSPEGVREADFLLYASVAQSQRCDTQEATAAYSSFCQLEGALDRPIAGYVNICPTKLSVSVHDKPVVRSTVQHEILHALGFSAGLYAFYRDAQGQPLTARDAVGLPLYKIDFLKVYQWSDAVVRQISRSWRTPAKNLTRLFHAVVTPNVVRAVREHFNCSTLEGAELEDQGQIGTQFTHWEKRLFENEAMTGTYTQNPSMSKITLALLEDTGWYKPDYSKADPLEWGRNMGCDFTRMSCHDWIVSRKARGSSIAPYCETPRPDDGSLKTFCTAERSAVVMCNLVKYRAPIHSPYTVFETLPDIADASLYGGSVALADYCPFLQEFTWRQGQEALRGSRCTDHVNNGDKLHNYAVEVYGNRSACLEHARPFSVTSCATQQSVTHWGSGCYQYACKEGVGLVLEVGGQSYPCGREGQRVRVNDVSDSFLHEGSLVCPACQLLCQGKISCPVEAPNPHDVPPPRREAPCRTSSADVMTASVLSAVVASVVTHLLSCWFVDRR